MFDKPALQRTLLTVFAVALTFSSLHPQVHGGRGIDESFSVSSLRKIAEATSVVERPAKAAEIIVLAPEEDRERIAVRVVRLFLSRYHSLAPSLVAEIAKQLPELAATVAAEAISLFPESAYSITKAAVSAAPERALEIALRAAALTPRMADTIAVGVQRGIPDRAWQYRAVIAGIQEARRTEHIDMAVFTIKIRIGSGTGITPKEVGRLFDGVEQRTRTDAEGNEFVFFEVDSDFVDIPEDLSGQEEDKFDVILRKLLATEDNPFTREVVKQEYVQITSKSTDVVFNTSFELIQLPEQDPENLNEGPSLIGDFLNDQFGGASGPSFEIIPIETIPTSD